MLDDALKILSNLNPYSIALLVMVSLVLLALISNKFKQHITTPLKLGLLLWIIFFGYKVYTGEHLYAMFTTPSEPAKYKKMMIDGRPVYIDRDTGEVFKRKPK